MLALCALNFIFSLVAALGNLLVIRALWKASSIPANLKKLFESLAFSDLTVGFFAQPMFGIINTVMLKMAANGNYNFDFLCPRILVVCHFSLFLLACASFLSITAIAVDRLFAVLLHLRYQELVTLKRVIIALVSFWVSSGVAASIYILLPKYNNLVAAIIEFAGLLLITVSNIRIYKVVKYHKNQIHSQLQLENAQGMALIREKKTAFNVLFVGVVFIACYVPHLCSAMLSETNSSRISLRAPNQATTFIILLNSSLNPIIFCWRYREIRIIVKATVKKILRITET